jgi:Fic family protein
MNTDMNPKSTIVRYEIPNHWIKYDLGSIQKDLIEARVAIEALRTTPYQRDWVENLQKMELKREVAGTSRIEGAEFTERELDEALQETAAQLQTRSQRQARAAVQTYRWIAKLPDDLPANADLILEMHRHIITGADDDHCPLGKLRGADQNVTFGQPRHRGASGGDECESAFARFTEAIGGVFRGHDPILQALAAHYHLAAMHPFLDGNGRTARALEALMLQRAGLRDVCFIAMSNYYYEEKTAYLTSLAAVRENNHDLTEFFRFALKGIALQARRILREIQIQVSKSLYRNLMYDLFPRLKSPRKRVIAGRQIEILKTLLRNDRLELAQIADLTRASYAKLRNPYRALIRDLNGLLHLKAIGYEKTPDNRHFIWVRLWWPREISETDFMERVRSFPKAKTLSFLTE